MTGCSLARLSILSVVVAAGASDAHAAGPAALNDVRVQAAHYLRRGMVEQARSIVRRAQMMPGARRDAKVQLLAGKVHQQVGDVEQSLIALRRAVEADPEGEVGRKAAEVEAEIRAEYGEVRIYPKAQGGRGHVRGRLLLEAPGGLIGLTRKRAFAEVRRSLASKERSYPARVYLPWGTFTANGASFRHRRGAPTEVAVSFPSIAVLRPPLDSVALDIVEAFLSGVGGQVRVFDSDDRGSLDMTAEDLRADPPDAIFTVGQDATLAARSRLSGVPVVHVRVPPHVDLGIDEESPDRVHGVARRASPRDVLSRLMAVASDVKRVAIIYDPGRSKSQAADAASAARDMNLEVFTAQVREAGDVEEALDDLHDVDAYWVFDDPVLLDWLSFGPIARHALLRKRPVVCASYDLARDGALMAVEPDPAAEGAAAAALTRQLLWGDGASLPRTTQARGVRWTLNRKVAILLGIDLPYTAIRESWRIVNTTPPEDVTAD